MEWKPRGSPTYAVEVLRARASLQLADEVGLAFRAERQRLGMSQRAYAAHRGLSLGTIIRLECAADTMKLGDVNAALAGTMFQLCLCHRPPDGRPSPATLPAPGPPGDAAQPPSAQQAADRSLEGTQGQEAHRRAPEESPAPQPVHPAFWPRAELIARVRGGSRRFPAHHVTEQVDTGPPWWWYAESSRAGAVSPHWYAPQYTRRSPSAS